MINNYKSSCIKTTLKFESPSYGAQKLERRWVKCNFCKNAFTKKPINASTCEIKCQTCYLAFKIKTCYTSGITGYDWCDTPIYEPREQYYISRIFYRGITLLYSYPVIQAIDPITDQIYTIQKGQTFDLQKLLNRTNLLVPALR